MINANVKKISNGFIVTQTSPVAPAIDTVFAATVVECVYWLGRMFDPVGNPPALDAQDAPAPSIIAPPADPTVGQVATVGTVASGGFIVAQLPNAETGAEFVEVYCVNMDAVSAALTEIFAAPVVEE